MMYRPKKVSGEACKKVKRDLQMKQQALKTLLRRPALPKKFSGKFPDVNLSKMAINNVSLPKLNSPGAYVLKKVPVAS